MLNFICSFVMRWSITSLMEISNVVFTKYIFEQIGNIILLNNQHRSFPILPTSFNAHGACSYVSYFYCIPMRAYVHCMCVCVWELITNKQCIFLAKSGAIQNRNNSVLILMSNEMLNELTNGETTFFTLFLEPILSSKHTTYDKWIIYIKAFMLTIQQEKENKLQFQLNGDTIIF